MEVVKKDFFQFVRGGDVDGVEELGVDGVAVGFFFVVDGKFGVLEDEELVGVFDQPFGAAVIIPRMTLAAKASQVGFYGTEAAAYGAGVGMLFSGRGVEAVAGGVGTQRSGIFVVEDFGNLREGFTFGEHLADLLVAVLFGGVGVDLQAFGFGDFAGNGVFLYLVEFS